MQVIAPVDGQPGGQIGGEAHRAKLTTAPGHRARPGGRVGCGALDVHAFVGDISQLGLTSVDRVDGGGKEDGAPVANACMERSLTHIGVTARAPDRPVDLQAAATAARSLLTALGIDLSDEGVTGTPERMARSYAEFLTPSALTPTTFPNDGAYDELVVATSIPFHSLCEHHLLPFIGVAHVGYLPGERILGLSKLARVVELFARRLQVQERLTAQVAGWLDDHLQPKGVGVVLEAEHLCMSLRGVQKPGARTVTSALHGLVRDDPATRQEFLDLTRRRA